MSDNNNKAFSDLIRQRKFQPNLLSSGRSRNEKIENLLQFAESMLTREELPYCKCAACGYRNRDVELAKQGAFELEDYICVKCNQKLYPSGL